MKYKKLRGRIIEKFENIKKFSEKMDVSLTTISKKLNARVEFSKDDMIAWGELLEIPAEEYYLYFFD